MKSFFHRIRNSIRYLLITSWKWTAALYAIAGLLGLFVSFEELFDVKTTFWCKLLNSVIILVTVWLICFIIASFKVGFQRKKKVVDGQNGKAVYVVYGDLFDSDIVDERKRYICFAVNRCFDTIIDDRLISSTSIHGIAFNKLYEQKKYTQRTLNTAIQSSIHSAINPIVVHRTDKPEGNLKRYEVGSYSNICVDGHLNYLLLGLTWINANLNARTSKSDYVLAIQKMIESFDNESQGYPVLMPIIGTGRSRTDLKENEALEYLIEAFRINQNKITSDVFIVIQESAKNRVSIVDL